MPMSDCICARTEHVPKERPRAALADMAFRYLSDPHSHGGRRARSVFPLDGDTTDTRPDPTSSTNRRPASFVGLGAFCEHRQFMTYLRGYDD